jgi:hypothetical protein
MLYLPAVSGILVIEGSPSLRFRLEMGDKRRTAVGASGTNPHQSCCFPISLRRRGPTRGTHRCTRGCDTEAKSAREMVSGRGGLRGKAELERRVPMGTGQAPQERLNWPRGRHDRRSTSRTRRQQKNLKNISAAGALKLEGEGSGSWRRRRVSFGLSTTLTGCGTCAPVQ